MKNSTREILETTAQILWRCWALGFALLLLTVGGYFLGGDLVEQLHGNMFNLSAHELDLIMYCGMGLIKLLVLVLFLIPWLAIRSVLRVNRE